MSKLDFISRSELLAEIDQERKRHIDSGNYGAEHLMVHSLRRLVEEAHAVDAAPVVHGRWIEKQEATSWCDDDVFVFYECSVCHDQDGIYSDKFSYCPNCGAKMDREG